VLRRGDCGALHLAVVLAFLFAAAGALAASGERRTGACTATTQPGRGLQRFVDGLRAGDVGCLRAGDYDAKRLVLRRHGTARARITLRSADPRHRATIHGRVWVSSAASYWTIEQLDFDGRNPHNLPSPVINGDDTVWRQVDVTNHHAGDGATSGGICFLLGDTSRWGIPRDTAIVQSRIHDCGVSDNSNHGIYISATAGTTLIENNWIYRNGDRGVQLYPDAAHVRIVHNVIDQNGTGVIFSGVGRFASRQNVVADNIISNSRNRWNVESWYPDGTSDAVGNVVAGNCFWATNASPSYDTDGGVAPPAGFSVGTNVVERPLFAAPEGGDFRLLRGSGCEGYGPVAGREPSW
jgi:parallel beta-helix repeat protein